MSIRLRFDLFRTIGLACATATLAYASLAQSQEPNRVTPTKKAKVAVVSTAQQAQTVVKDPLTGVLRAPTDEERAALNPDSSSTADAEVRPGSIIVHESGARGLGVGEATMTYAVATRNPDGSVSQECVQGPEQAQRVIKANKIAKSFSKTQRYAQKQGAVK